jgi:hypothetical protein
VPIGLKQRTQLGSFPASRMNGSPIQNLARKAASTAQRPRKQFRRTLSMFEHPADVMRTEKKQVSLDVVMDVDENPQLILPNFVPEDKPDSLPRILIKRPCSLSSMESTKDLLIEQWLSIVDSNMNLTVAI